MLSGHKTAQSEIFLFPLFMLIASVVLENTKITLAMAGEAWRWLAMAGEA